MFDEALAVRSAALGPTHPEMTIALTSQAIFYDVTGRIADAVKRQTEAANVTERNLDLILASGSETQKLRYMETYTENTDVTVSMHRVSAPADPAAQSLALTTLLRRKGRVLDAVGGALQALRDRMSDDDRAALDRLSAARMQLARLVLRGPGRQDAAIFNREVAAAEDQLQQAEREISTRSAVYRAQSRPVTIDAVKTALPAGAALVEIAIYRPFNNRIVPRDKRFGAARYVAYVVRAGAEPASVDLGDVSVIDEQVETLRRALSNSKRPDPKSASAELYQSLMRPILPLLGDSAEALHLARWIAEPRAVRCASGLQGPVCCGVSRHQLSDKRPRSAAPAGARARKRPFADRRESGVWQRYFRGGACRRTSHKPELSTCHGRGSRRFRAPLRKRPRCRR